MTGQNGEQGGHEEQQPDRPQRLRDGRLHHARAEPARSQRDHEDRQQKRADTPELQNEVGEISSEDADPVAGSVRAGENGGAVERRIERRIRRKR